MSYDIYDSYLKDLKECIENLMWLEVEKDSLIPVIIIDLLAVLHSEVSKYFDGKKQ